MEKRKCIAATVFAIGLCLFYLDAQVSKGMNRIKASSARAEIRADPQKIRAHVRFLSSDLLEGRGTGQRGGDIAADYIATQFACTD